MVTDPLLSTGFRLSEEAAGALLGDARALRTLLSFVEAQQRAHGIDIATRIHLDIAEAIVDAHIEQLTEPGLSRAGADALRRDPRCRLVVAALHYVAVRDCPPFLGDDDADDLDILRRATDLARGCPV